MISVKSQVLVVNYRWKNPSGLTVVKVIMVFQDLVMTISGLQSLEKEFSGLSFMQSETTVISETFLLR